MNILFRVLLGIYAFCLMILSAFMMVVTVKSTYLDVIYDYFRNDVLGSRDSAIMMFVIVLIFFVLSLVFLMSGLKSSKDKSSVGKHNDIGEVKISLATIENIALSTSKKINGVRETRANVKKNEDSVSVEVSLIVMPGINIPELTVNMQERVKKTVEDISGIAVRDVKVEVDNIYSGAVVKSRVE